MSIPIQSNNLSTVISLLTPKFPAKKSTIVSFLKEIYTNVSKRSNHNMNTYTFQEITNIPMIISDKIYFVLNEHTRKIISLTQFANGLYQLIYSDILYKIRIAFEVFDFDNDNTVTKDDTFLILSHFHFIQNTSDNIALLEKLINEFFMNEKSLTKDLFFEKCKKETSDICILLFVFINNYLCLFNEHEINYYETITGLNSEKEQSNNLGTIIKPSSFEYIENGYFKITNNLFEYLDNVIIDPKLIFSPSYTEDDNDCSMDDLEELKNFENDMHDIFQKIGSLSLKSYKSKLTKNKTFFPTTNKNYKLIAQQTILSPGGGASPINNKNNIQTYNLNIYTYTENDNNNNNINNLNQNKGKGNVNNNDLFKPLDNSIHSSNFDDTKSPVKKLFLPQNTNTTYYLNASNHLKKAATDCQLPISTIKHKHNELVLFKSKNNTKTSTIIKLSLVHRSIFYSKYDKGEFLFKKILPIFALFPKKVIMNTFVQLNLISTVHNYYKQYSFFAENIDEVNSFISQFNSNAQFEKITDHYELRTELGRGKFGNVILAQKKQSDINELFAIKIVNKNNPTDEEYKINRWESSIFNILKHISHPNVIKCIEKFENENNIFFVYEYIMGSDLKNYTQIRSLELSPSKKQIINISIQIIKGMACLHKYGIIHRDVKTTNIMIANPKDEERTDNVKIIDYGLSRVLGKDEYSLDPYGSLCFKAPELIQHSPYNFKVDVWAVGVTIYYLMFKSLPFEKGTKHDIKRSIVEDNINFPLFEGNGGDDIYESSHSDSFLYALVGDCLEKNPLRRPSIENIISKYVERYQEEEDDKM